jgi:hypothetical protein
LADFPAGRQGQEANFKRRLAEYVERRDLHPVDADDFAQGTSVKYACSTKCGGLDTVRFLLLPEKNMRRLDWDEELVQSDDREARIIAVYINLDDVPVPGLGLNRGDQMHIWAGRIMTDDTRGIGVFRYNAADSSVTYIDGAQAFKVCTDPMVRTRRKASIKVGPQPGHVCPNAQKVSRGTGAVRTGKLWRGPPDNVWVACDGGCCQADM